MKFKLFGKALVVLTLVAIFGLLGLWQLDAANDLQEAKNAAPDPIVYQLSDLASPATALDSRSVAKKFLCAEITSLLFVPLIRSISKVL